MHTLYLGSDHGGFAHKEELKERLQAMGYQVHDLGAHQLDPVDDYPQYAFAVAEAVAQDQESGTESMGVLLCRSGAGMEIAANKVEGIRAVRAENTASAKVAREHNDANILTIAADSTTVEQAVALIQLFIETPFSGESRHARRLAAIEQYERVA